MPEPELEPDIVIGSQTVYVPAVEEPPAPEPTPIQIEVTYVEPSWLGDPAMSVFGQQRTPMETVAVGRLFGFEGPPMAVNQQLLPIMQSMTPLEAAEQYGVSFTDMVEAAGNTEFNDMSLEDWRNMIQEVGNNIPQQGITVVLLDANQEQETLTLFEFANQVGSFENIIVDTVPDDPDEDIMLPYPI